jgi:hypothetical protein
MNEDEVDRTTGRGVEGGVRKNCLSSRGLDNFSILDSWLKRSNVFIPLIAQTVRPYTARYKDELPLGRRLQFSEQAAPDDGL